ncbi:MAG: 6-hydroxymethylpterin diphosphokinase MptE-like protein [Haloarculaceae archaeon]
MNFETWEPVYEAILASFGFDRAADERARDRFAEIVGDRDPADLDGLAVEDSSVAIAGGAATLSDELDTVENADTVFAAGASVSRLQEASLDVDCVVTDLDSAPEQAVALAREGTPVVAHAHGDNIPGVEEYGPRLAEGALVPTTQAAPAGPVRNFGGFTDGDRAAFLADYLGAADFVFPGWDFEDASVDPMKARKLGWAERLLYWLEWRRGERFGVLDGRRDGIDTDALPL